jgi:hypothetical protein
MKGVWGGCIVIVRGGEGKKGHDLTGVKPASYVELGTLFFLDLEKIWWEHFMWTP